MLWTFFIVSVMICVILSAICVIACTITFFIDKKSYDEYFDLEEEETDEDISERT